MPEMLNAAIQVYDILTDANTNTQSFFFYCTVRISSHKTSERNVTIRFS